jgi:hypothetical protein
MRARTHANGSPPNGPTPASRTFSSPSAHTHCPACGTPLPVCDCDCAPLSRIKTEAPHQQSISGRRICMGFLPVPVHHAPSNLGPRTVGSSGRRDGYASMVVLRTPSCERSWLGGLPQHVVALRTSAVWPRVGARTRSRPALHTCGLRTRFESKVLTRTKLTLVLPTFRTLPALAPKRAESLQLQPARSDVTLQDLIGTFGSTGASSAANAPGGAEVETTPLGAIERSAIPRRLKLLKVPPPPRFGDSSFG